MSLKDRDRELEVIHRRLLIISPLISGVIVGKERDEVIDDICKKHNISRKTVLRYLSYYQEWQKTGDMSALAPKGRPDITAKIPKTIVDKAIELRKERPDRSVNQIITIMENNGFIEKDSVKRSTLQEALSKRGYSAQRIRMLIDDSAKSTRFQKDARNQLWMGDIKYGPTLTIKGKEVKTYLSVIIDDYSRHIIHAKFYDNQEATIIVDSLKHAFKEYGLPEMLYFDNGRQYTNELVSKACLTLGVKISHAKPRHAWSKGKVEALILGISKSFLGEFEKNPTNSLEDLNRRLDAWVNKIYERRVHSATGKKPHDMYFDNLESVQKLVDERLVDIAFLNTASRKCNKCGEFSWHGQSYFAGKEYAGKTVIVSFESKKDETIYISCDGSDWMKCTKTEVGPYVKRYARMKEDAVEIDEPSDFLTDLIRQDDPDYVPPRDPKPVPSEEGTPKTDDVKDMKPQINYGRTDDDGKEDE